MAISSGQTTAKLTERIHVYWDNHSHHFDSDSSRRSGRHRRLAILRYRLLRRRRLRSYHRNSVALGANGPNLKYSRHSRIKFTVFRARAKPFGVKITTEASLTGTGHIHVRFWHKADIGIRALAGWMCRHFRARLARVRHTSAVNPRSVPCGDWMWSPDKPPTLLNAAESKAHCAKVTSNFGGSPQLLNPVMTQSLAMVQATVNLSTNVARQELASYIQGNEARAHIDGPRCW